MKCHKCGKEMLKTPCCADCGIIPAAEADVQVRKQEINRLRLCLKRVKKAQDISTAHQLAEMGLNGKGKA